jgi:transposase InsO family protein
VFFGFVIDAFSRRVVGWQFAAHLRTDLVLDARRMALTRREHGAGVQLIYHSDAGSQYTSFAVGQPRVARLPTPHRAYTHDLRLRTEQIRLNRAAEPSSW